MTAAYNHSFLISNAPSLNRWVSLRISQFPERVSMTLVTNLAFPLRPGTKPPAVVSIDNVRRLVLDF